MADGLDCRMSIDANGSRGARYFTVDIHLHTSRGSADSNLAPNELVERAAGVGIGAICITEHDTMWDVSQFAAMARDRGVLLLRGMEVTTDMGHIGVFGLDGYLGGIYKLSELRRVADKHGAILIANHPFRYRLDAQMSFLNSDHEPIDAAHPERAAKMEIFRMVDAIEALNGACSEEENLFALKVAERLGLAVVAGSDSHSASSIGCVTTLFSEPVRDERELIDAIRARRPRAGRGLLCNAVAPFEVPVG